MFAGTRFDNSPMPGVGALQWNSGSQRAMMFLFSGQELPDIIVRPNRFQFDGNFASALQDDIEGGVNAYRESIGGNYPSSDFVNLDVVNESIRPSSRGIIMPMHSYEELYKFLLIIDNPQFKTSGGNSGRTSNSRLIYFGYVLSADPVTKRFGRNIFDQSAILMPTHVTRTQVNTVAHPEGQINRGTVVADVDILRPDALRQLNNDRIYSLEPDKLIRSYTADGDGSSIRSEGMVNICNYRDRDITMDTRLKSPKQQIRSLHKALRTVKNFQSEGISTTELGGHGKFRMLDADFNSDRMAIADRMRRALPDEHVGLSLHREYTLGTLLEEWPSLRDNIEVLNIPFNLEVDALQTENPTRTNIWTAMVQSVLPSWLAHMGICDIAFRYSTVNTTESFSINNDPVYEVYDLGTVIPASTESMRARWELLLEALSSELFAPIMRICGDFDLTVRYSANNYFLVQLQLLDEEPIDGYAIQHGVLMPIVTPLVGSFDDYQANAEQLDGVISFVTAGGFENLRF